MFQQGSPVTKKSTLIKQRIRRLERDYPIAKELLRKKKVLIEDITSEDPTVLAWYSDRINETMKEINAKVCSGEFTCRVTGKSKQYPVEGGGYVTSVLASEKWGIYQQIARYHLEKMVRIWGLVPRKFLDNPSTFQGFKKGIRVCATRKLILKDTGERVNLQDLQRRYTGISSESIRTLVTDLFEKGEFTLSKLDAKVADTIESEHGMVAWNTHSQLLNIRQKKRFVYLAKKYPELCNKHEIHEEYGFYYDSLPPTYGDYKYRESVLAEISAEMKDIPTKDEGSGSRFDDGTRVSSVKLAELIGGITRQQAWVFIRAMISRHGTFPKRYASASGYKQWLHETSVERLKDFVDCETGEEFTSADVCEKFPHVPKRTVQRKVSYLAAKGQLSLKRIQECFS